MPRGRPRHSLGHGTIEEALSQFEDINVDSSGGVKLFSETRLVTKFYSIFGEEDQSLWRDKFLKSPSTSEPPTVFEDFEIVSRFEHFGRALAAYICQIDVAYLGLRIPGKHTVDCFGQLRTTSIVDAAGVNPSIPYIILLSFLTAQPDLFEPNSLYLDQL